MASPVQLQQLLLRVRQETDTENELVRHPDTTLTDFINRGIKQLHTLMIRCDGQGYFEFDTTFNSVPGQEMYPIASGAMQVTKMWTFWPDPVTGVERVLRGYEPTETDGMRPNMTFDGISVHLPVWRIVGSNISLRPTQNLVWPFYYRSKGIPLQLVNPTDSIDGVSGHDDFVVFWASRRVFMKDGRTDLIGAATADLQAVQAAIETTVRALNRGQPQRIVDKRGSSVSRHYGRAWRGYWNNWR